METFGEVLSAAVRVDAGGLAAAHPQPARGGAAARLHAPVVLQSWPGIVHGGAVAALLDSAAELAGPRVVEARLTSPLPVETELSLAREPGDASTMLVVRQGAQTLTSGTVRPLEGSAAPVTAWSGGRDGAELPMSDDCLACGARNPLGLRAVLRLDGEGVWVRITPSPEWATGDGQVHLGVAPVLLDEIAWWMGAVRTGEGGVTNRLALHFLVPAIPSGPALIAAGRFTDVTPVDRRRSFWRVEAALVTEDGRVLATAAIVYRCGPEYSTRQLGYFRARTTPELFRQMFPGHA